MGSEGIRKGEKKENGRKKEREGKGSKKPIKMCLGFGQQITVTVNHLASCNPGTNSYIALHRKSGGSITNERVCVLPVTT
jgi:hypothetical protein